MKIALEKKRGFIIRTFSLVELTFIWKGLFEIPIGIFLVLVGLVLEKVGLSLF